MNQESLWQFALAAYGRDGMESVCLALQDQQGININVLLWSLWLDHNAVGFDRGFWQQSVQAINAVHARVVRVRSLRRWIPKRRGLLWLRNPVKAWELRLEKSELMQLQNLTDFRIRLSFNRPDQINIRQADILKYLMDIGLHTCGKAAQDQFTGAI